ncbi:MAG: DNA gyrase inhibitor YacG [Acetobacteraceae bacterium]
MSQCPICRKDSVALYRPFCSKRCADFDLGNWFRGNYRVPLAQEDEIPSHEESEGEKDQDAT